MISMQRTSLAAAIITILAACSAPPTNDDQDTVVDELLSTTEADTGRADSMPKPRREMKLLEEAEAAPANAPATPESRWRQQDGAAVPLGIVAGEPACVGCDLRSPSESLNREQYEHFDDNPVHRVADQPVSTFSIDVDTGAYANVRRILNQGQLPPNDAVRIEEMINYFDYAYPHETDEHPFSVHTELGPAPWHEDRALLSVGIQGYTIPDQQIPASNLVFLIDVSGSMQSPDKLDLLKSAFKLMVRQLDERDSVAIAVYAGAAGMVLEPTPGDQHGKIIAALDGLTAGGSTNGGAGIRLAYSMARDAFIEGGVNRVILASDGDFNVGTVNFEDLVNLVEDQRTSGVALTTLGFGTGNYNDHLAEQLANNANGNHFYIDTLNEARKVLVDQLTATLLTIAADVKIQVEFNPTQVAEYRLIGYTNRLLRREDFNNDRVDAGEIGAGHTVTALYELALTDSQGQWTDPLRYQNEREAIARSRGTELAFLRLRYKQPGEDTSVLLSEPILRDSMVSELDQTSPRFRFAAAVAGFGEMLRGGEQLGAGFGYDELLELAQDARGDDPFGYRGEFLQLVRLAQSLTPATMVSQRN